MEEKTEVKKESLIVIKIGGEVYELKLTFRDYLILEQTLDIGLTALIQLSANKGLKLVQIATILHLASDKKFGKNELLNMMDPEDSTSGELNSFYATGVVTRLLLKILVDQMESMPAEFKKKKAKPKMKIPKSH